MVAKMSLNTSFDFSALQEAESYIKSNSHHVEVYGSFARVWLVHTIPIILIIEIINKAVVLKLFRFSNGITLFN